jgi:hypothetical protein
MSGAIIVRRLQRDDDVAVVGKGKPLLRNSWPRNVPAQALKLLALIRLAGDRCVGPTIMQRKASLFGYQVVAPSLQIAVDFVPETIAAAICINEWLSQQEDLAPGSTAERGVGFGSFELSGSTINALAQPYRFYLLQRLQDEFEALNSDERRMLRQCLPMPVCSKC